MCVIVTCAVVFRMILWSLAIWSTFSILKIQFSCLTYSSSVKKKTFSFRYTLGAIPCDFLITFPAPSSNLECEKNHSEKTNFSPLPVFNVVKRRNLYTHRFLGVWLAPPLALGFIFRKTFPLHFTNCFLPENESNPPFYTLFVLWGRTHIADYMTSLDTFGRRTSVNSILQILPFLSPARSCSGRLIFSFAKKNH
jgi:hypothetical protein